MLSYIRHALKWAMRLPWWVALGAWCVGATATAYAQETVTFAYDPLGRLTGSQIQSGPESGLTESYSYDPAGNRTQYQVSGSTPPTPVTISMSNTTVNQIPGGTPLTVSFTGSSVSGTVSFTENGMFLGSTWVANGVASIILVGFPKGVHNITAIYSGDGRHAAQTINFTIKVQNLNWLPAVLDLLLSN
jgi:YD repeat-containing protein